MWHVTWEAIMDTPQGVQRVTLNAYSECSEGAALDALMLEIGRLEKMGWEILEDSIPSSMFMSNN